jgi:hypothetical protein
VTMQAQANSFSPFSVTVAVLPAGTMHSGKMSHASANTTRVPLATLLRSNQFSVWALVGSVAFADREIVQPLFQRRQVIADPFGATNEQMPLPRRAGLLRPMRLHLFDVQSTEVDKSFTGRLTLPAAIGEHCAKIIRPSFAGLKLFEVHDLPPVCSVQRRSGTTLASGGGCSNRRDASASSARSILVGNRCPYTSMVMTMDECPR